MPSTETTDNWTGDGNRPCPHYLPEIFDPGDRSHLDWAEWWVDALEFRLSSIMAVETRLPGLSGEKALAELVAVKRVQDDPIRRWTQQRRDLPPSAPQAAVSPSVAKRLRDGSPRPGHGTAPRRSGTHPPRRPF